MSCSPAVQLPKSYWLLLKTSPNSSHNSFNFFNSSFFTDDLVKSILKLGSIITLDFPKEFNSCSFPSDSSFSISESTFS
ncbi:unnamed protein product [Meloidogyne enterolobii]|uniref:Uncharacterized protein n=1 Tax=Meloidogyne enterolobii TaxID=390850 RepID=A0ACB0YFC2_MELEN